MQRILNMLISKHLNLYVLYVKVELVNFERHNVGSFVIQKKKKPHVIQNLPI